MGCLSYSLPGRFTVRLLLAWKMVKALKQKATGRPWVLRLYWWELLFEGQLITA